MFRLYLSNLLIYKGIPRDVIIWAPDYYAIFKCDLLPFASFFCFCFCLFPSYSDPTCSFLMHLQLESYNLTLSSSEKWKSEFFICRFAFQKKSCAYDCIFHCSWGPSWSKYLDCHPYKFVLLCCTSWIYNGPREKNWPELPDWRVIPSSSQVLLFQRGNWFKLLEYWSFKKLRILQCTLWIRQKYWKEEMAF